jgi:hypothetical protein
MRPGSPPSASPIRTPASTSSTTRSTSQGRVSAMDITDSLLELMAIDTHIHTVSKPFGNREETVWVAAEPRRMQTWKEVRKMHAAITRNLATLAGLMTPFVVTLAAIVLSLAFVPAEPGHMPVYCPPNC